MNCSIKVLLNLFFLALFIVAWAVPVILVLKGANSTVEQSVARLGDQTSNLMLSQLAAQFSTKIRIGLSFRNWTQINDVPLKNSVNRRTYNNLIAGQLLNARRTNWAYAFMRFDDGSVSWVTAVSRTVLHAQLCRSQTGIWNANSTIVTPDIYYDCDNFAVNLTTGSMLSPGDPLSNMSVPTFARSFVRSISWNVTYGLLNAPPFNDNTTGWYSGHRYVPQSDPDSLVLGFFRVGRYQNDYSRAIMLQNNGLPSSMFTPVLKSLLPPVEGSRAFFIEANGFVVFSTHSLPLEFRPYRAGVDQVDAGCFTSADLTSLACQHNASDYSEYLFVRLFYAQTGGSVGGFGPSFPNTTVVTTPGDDIQFYATRSPLPVDDAVFTLLLFIPLDYWTESIHQATTTVIVVCVVVILIGAFLTHLLLRMVAGRIEDLADQMYKDPFAKAQSQINNNINNEKNNQVEQCERETKEELDTTSWTIHLWRSGSCALAELVEIEDEFEKFRQVIEQLRSFMPVDFSKKNGNANAKKNQNNDDNANNNNNSNCKNSASAPSGRKNSVSFVLTNSLKASDNEHSSSNVDEENNKNNHHDDAKTDGFASSIDSKATDNTAASEVRERDKEKNPIVFVSDHNNNHSNNDISNALPLRSSLSPKRNRWTVVTVDHHNDDGNYRSSVSAVKTSSEIPIDFRKQQTPIHQGNNFIRNVAATENTNKNEPCVSGNFSGFHGSGTMISMDPSAMAAVAHAGVAAFVPKSHNNNSNSVAYHTTDGFSSGTVNQSLQQVPPIIFGSRLEFAKSEQTKTSEITCKKHQCKSDCGCALHAFTQQVGDADDITGDDCGVVRGDTLSTRSGTLVFGSEPSPKNSISNSNNEAAISPKKNVKFNGGMEVYEASGEKYSKNMIVTSSHDHNQQQDDGSNDEDKKTRNQNDDADGLNRNSTENSNQHNNDVNSTCSESNSSVTSDSFVIGDDLIMTESFGGDGNAGAQKKKPSKSKRKRTASISAHRILFTVIHVHGTIESVADAWEGEKLELAATTGASPLKNSDGRSAAFDDFSPSGFANKTDSQQQQFASGFHRQKLLDRSRLIAEIINNDVIESSGAHLIEYRNDTFYAVLRLSKRETQSKLAYRFVCKLIDAANKLAEHDLQHAYNFAEGRKPHAIALSAGLAVGDARFLSLPITAGETIARPVTVLSTCVRDAVDVERRMRYTAAGSSPYRPLSHAIGYYVAGTTHDTLAISSFTSDLFNPAVRLIYHFHQEGDGGSSSGLGIENAIDHNNNNNNNNCNNGSESSPAEKKSKNQGAGNNFSSRAKILLAAQKKASGSDNNDKSSGGSFFKRFAAALNKEEGKTHQQGTVRHFSTIARVCGVEPIEFFTAGTSISTQGKIKEVIRLSAPCVFPPE